MKWIINRLGEFLENWRDLVHNQGWKQALPRIGRDIIHLPYRHLEFFIVARSLSEPLPNLSPKIPLDIREITSNDVALIREIDTPSQANVCRRRLAYGHQGLLALHNGQPAGYAWGCATFEPDLERVHLNLNPDDMLCVDVYTAPAFRNRGIQTTLVLARFRLFQDLGYQRAIAYIETHNYPSLAVWKKVGSNVVGRIDFLRIGPWRRVRYSFDALANFPGD